MGAYCPLGDIVCYCNCFINNYSNKTNSPFLTSSRATVPLENYEDEMSLVIKLVLTILFAAMLATYLASIAAIAFLIFVTAFLYYFIKDKLGSNATNGLN